MSYSGAKTGDSFKTSLNEKNYPGKRLNRSLLKTRFQYVTVKDNSLDGKKQRMFKGNQKTPHPIPRKYRARHNIACILYTASA